MDTLLMTLAGCGLLMIAIGRYLILRQARDISGWWVMALRILPMAELMFLSRYWEQAKVGAFTSLIGMALIMPWGGKMLAEQQKSMPGAHKRAMAGKVLSEVEKEERLKAKKERLHAMNARLLGWYKEIQTRRNSLGPSADVTEIATFNAEAAAYHAFSAVTREEANALEPLREIEKTAANPETPRVTQLIAPR